MQERKSRAKARVEDTQLPEQEQTAPSVEDQERRQELTEELDGLLDEIDEVLESNAEEFVRAYVQKGGQ